jgi:hypothetical protein
LPKIAGSRGAIAGFGAWPARTCVSTNVMLAISTSIEAGHRVRHLGRDQRLRRAELAQHDRSHCVTSGFFRSGPTGRERWAPPPVKRV